MTELVVQGIKDVAERIPNEAASEKVVLVTTHIVRRFKHLASQLGKRVSKFPERRTRINQVFITSSYIGGQDGDGKEGKVHGKQMHNGWVVECWFRCCQSHKIVRKWQVEDASESDGDGLLQVGGVCAISAFFGWI
jgi:hypothetical protein